MDQPNSAVFPDASRVTEALLGLLSRIPSSQETAQSLPEARAREVAKAAAMRAAAISGALALPPGPLGLTTVLPDLLAIWRLQQGMVADIAAVYGKSASLRREAMIYCLFKHGGAALVRDLVSRVGERIVIKQTTVAFIQKVLQKVGVQVTEKMISKAVSRWVPLVGAVGMGAYAYYDTNQVAATAIELFSSDLDSLAEPDETSSTVSG
ncbi:MAG: hypothetical protein RLY71_3085 [Pseudomonadota bacterium]|jgi:uncharacterized protein (DUF697 family)